MKFILPTYCLVFVYRCISSSTTLFLISVSQFLGLDAEFGDSRFTLFLGRTKNLICNVEVWKGKGNHRNLVHYSIGHLFCC